MRGQQAPWDYDCPYKHRCPHLSWQSTHWVWSEYQRSYDEHCEHWRVRDIQQEELDNALKKIVDLENENEWLQAKLKAIHQKQFKANICKDKGSDDGPNRIDTLKKDKKRGAPKGHTGWSRRKPDHARAWGRS